MVSFNATVYADSILAHALLQLDQIYLHGYIRLLSKQLGAIPPKHRRCCR